MSRKDYIKIVETLSACVEDVGAENVYKVAGKFCAALLAENPRFDADKFQKYLGKCIKAQQA